MRTTFVLSLVLSLSVANAASADVKLPRILDSHMVLQRDMKLPIWGWADAGEKITVRLDDSKAFKTVAGKDGKWIVTLPPAKADGKKHTLTVEGNNKIQLNDILIGEVWIGSGQSNMEWRMNRLGRPDKVKQAKNPHIRLFHVPRAKAKQPAKDVQAKNGDVTAGWKPCTPKNVEQFSATLYFFGKNLQEKLDVPIGLINSSWGGTRIEPWTLQNDSKAVLYNGMIAPLQPLAFRGAIWYQGESNVFGNVGFDYYDKMKQLISGWRKKWDRQFPFYFVQIAPWAGRYPKGELPKLWEAQVASLKIPNTGMIVVTDLVDNIKDIHPRNKWDVGERLSRWALAKTYDKKGIVYSGPLYKSMKLDGDKVRLNFAHATGGLKTRDGKKLTEFEIAGKDGQFVPAMARVDGKSVVVWSPKVPKPVEVRFGWHKTTNPNLINEAGLPASPFRTKNWRGGTGE